MVDGIRGAQMRYLKTQLFAKSAVWLAVQSALGFSFMSVHHASLPTSGAQAVSANNAIARAARVLFLMIFMFVLNNN